MEFISAREGDQYGLMNGYQSNFVVLFLMYQVFQMLFMISQCCTVGLKCWVRMPQVFVYVCVNCLDRKASVVSNGSSASSVVEKPGPTIPELSKPSANIPLCDQNNLADDSVPAAKSSQVENGKDKLQKLVCCVIKQIYTMYLYSDMLLTRGQWEACRWNHLLHMRGLTSLPGGIAVTYIYCLLLHKCALVS